MDRAAARRSWRPEGVGKVKALEVRTLWLEQLVKAKTLKLKTVKSVDNCANLKMKMWGGWYIERRSMNGLVRKRAINEMVGAAMISSGENS